MQVSVFLPATKLQIIKVGISKYLYLRVEAWFSQIQSQVLIILPRQQHIEKKNVLQPCDHYQKCLFHQWQEALVLNLILNLFILGYY